MIDRISKYIVIKWFSTKSLYRTISKSVVATFFYIIFCKVLEYEGFMFFIQYVHIFWFSMALFYFNKSKEEDETRMVYRERECVFNHSIEELEFMTERIKTSAVEIENKEKFLRTILRSLTEGMIGITMKGTIKLCNPAASRLFGYRNNELIGKSVCSLFPEVFKKDQIDEIVNGQEDYQKCIKAVAVGKNKLILDTDITISKIKKDLKDFVILTIRQPSNYI